MRSDSTPGRSDAVPKIGDALDDVDTPALIVELDALERNVATMAAAVEDRGVRLRPHAKSHKCSGHCQASDRRGRGRHLLPESRRGRGVCRCRRHRRADYQ